MSGKIICLVLILLIFSSFTAAGEVYVIFTDRELGFWAVRSYDINHTLNYTSRTLNINTGDSIEWMNMDTKGDRITIVSDDNLWEGGEALGSQGSKFKFTFNSSGIYRFHIAENTRIRINSSNYSQNETTTTTVTYEDDDGQLQTITVTREENDRRKAEISTEQYNYQRQTIQVTGPTIGNGTHPILDVQPTPTFSQFTATIRPAVQGTTSPTPTSTPAESLTQEVAAAVIPKPLESYQEFTIYEVLKRWIKIIMSG